MSSTDLSRTCPSMTTVFASNSVVGTAARICQGMHPELANHAVRPMPGKGMDPSILGDHSHVVSSRKNIGKTININEHQ